MKNFIIYILYIKIDYRQNKFYNRVKHKSNSQIKHKINSFFKIDLRRLTKTTIDRNINQIPRLLTHKS